MRDVVGDKAMGLLDHVKTEANPDFRQMKTQAIKRKNWMAWAPNWGMLAIFYVLSVAHTLVIHVYIYFTLVFVIYLFS